MGDIKEYRYFPEYGGYLPVVRGKQKSEIRGEWLFPEDYPKDGSYELPLSPEEAERKIRERSHNEHLSAVSKTVLGIITLPITIPLYLIIGPLDHYYFSPKELRLREERLRQFAGVEVEISVFDPQGNPIPGAMVKEDYSSSGILCCSSSYIDKSGRRSFRPPRIQPYAVHADFFRDAARHLPIEFGKTMWCRGAGRPIGLKSHYAFDHTSDATGTVRYVSFIYDRYAEYTDSQWRWKEDPPTVRCYFIVWAPGFRPVVRAVEGVQPRQRIELFVTLEPLPEHEHVSRIVREFLALRDEFVKRCGALGDGRLKETIERLQTWAEDESLPSYLRLNAFEFLKSIKKYTRADLEAFLQNFAGTAASLSVYLEEGLRNPWKFREEYLKWDAEMHRLCYGVENSKMKISFLAKEARQLLSEGEEIDPGIPQLETLRAVIDLADGRRQEAVTKSRYMNHCDFFGLFYPDIVFSQVLEGK